MSGTRYKDKKLGRPRKGVNEGHVKLKAINMMSKFPSKCCECGGDIPEGSDILYYPDLKTASHKLCKKVPKDSKIPKKEKTTKEPSTQSFTLNLRCSKCGLDIKGGAEVRMDSGFRLSHTKCPASGWNPYEDEPPF